QLSFTANFRLAWEKYLAEMQTRGLFATLRRYRIRKIENASAAGIARVKAYVVLHTHLDTANRALIREVMRTVVSQLSRRLIETNPSDIIKRTNWRNYPKYIWINLYQYDGPIRWLEAGGWPKGNLIATAEKIIGSQYQPIYVKNPEETWKGIRLRFSMDLPEVARATVEMLKVAEEISSQQHPDRSQGH
ncbi:MAG TPA: hypothetical protein VII92_07765, partial [Anaerolineae bacterium]